MARLETIPVQAGTVRVAFTARRDGDLRVDADPGGLATLRRRVVDAPWTWLRQVHGADVVVVTEPGEWSGAEADGAVTTAAGCPLAVTTADCAPVVLAADRGVAVVHAGWRGLVAGIVEEAARKLAGVGGGAPVATLLGPCISPAAYEFGPDDLALVEARLGPTVRSTTNWGAHALDVPAAVAVACDRAGWPRPDVVPPCTSDDQWFSHRVRRDPGRQATVAWLVADPTPGGA
ncbi:MAG: laccase domain-containing protein [Acidimicrobiales bacterium]